MNYKTYPTPMKYRMLRISEAHEILGALHFDAITEKTLTANGIQQAS